MDGQLSPESSVHLTCESFPCQTLTRGDPWYLQQVIANTDNCTRSPNNNLTIGSRWMINVLVPDSRSTRFTDVFLLMASCPSTMLVIWDQTG